jgi:hypothetical protein
MASRDAPSQCLADGNRCDEAFSMAMCVVDLLSYGEHLDDAHRPASTGRFPCRFGNMS